MKASGERETMLRMRTKTLLTYPALSLCSFPTLCSLCEILWYHLSEYGDKDRFLVYNRLLKER